MSQSQGSCSEDMERFSRLSDKQKDALDLLLQHKTSKEIGLDLEISPHTVDQRIQIAKDKLGVASRGELAIEYQRLRSLCQQTVYEGSYIPKSSNNADQRGGFNAEPPEDRTGPKRTRQYARSEFEEDYRVVPEVFEGRYGTLMRVAAIVATALLMMLVILGGLVMFSQTSEIVAG